MIIGILFAEGSHFTRAWKVFGHLLENCEQDDIFKKNSASLAALMVTFPHFLPRNTIEKIRNNNCNFDQLL